MEHHYLASSARRRIIKGCNVNKDIISVKTHIIHIHKPFIYLHSSYIIVLIYQTDGTL